MEMSELEAIPNCLLLHGLVPAFQTCSIILVTASEAEKCSGEEGERPPRRSAPTTASSAAWTRVWTARRVYLGTCT